ncbi:MAG: bifunctional folylpolyglutamate synthase/dihydrofolate synthase [Acidobacteria bacterium]|nr:bifunctional folylpolyglutamate synthase/dihydrofolate synthase [Acidobacteriota bacterium]
MGQEKAGRSFLTLETQNPKPETLTMNFSETLAYLYSLGHETLAMKLGLESIVALCQALGNPQLKYRVVHIAGTNGKGSTAAMTEAIALRAGHRVGLYTSPHLVEITERIRIHGKDITQADFARLATQVRRASEQLVEQKTLPASPTYFEQVTAIGLLCFAEQNVDLAILEVGLGGRLDATNICQPTVCAITPVSLDHQEYLGNQLATIAAEKAGILKPEIPVVVAPQAPEAWNAIITRANEIKAPTISVAEFQAMIDEASTGMFHFQYHTGLADYTVQLNLRGGHQVINACTAIHIAEQLRQHGLCIPKTSIEEGLQNVNWAGRLEMIEVQGRQLLLDGAHNLAGAKTLQDFLRAYESNLPITMIFGVMNDKAIAGMAEMLFPFAQLIIATHINNPRSADPVVIVDAATQLGKPSRRTESVAAALQEALQHTPANGLICVCGSLYLIGEVKQLLTK